MLVRLRRKKQASGGWHYLVGTPFASLALLREPTSPTFALSDNYLIPHFGSTICSVFQVAQEQ